MPRTARIALPNYPHHVIQRGHNRQAVFADPDDYRYYLANLATWKTAYDCKVYAYCLMTNHVHLIIDPGDTPEHLGMLEAGGGAADALCQPPGRAQRYAVGGALQIESD